MRAHPIRVLLVEDDLDVAGGIGEFLGAHGLDVDFAYSAEQARSRVLDAAFDVFVFDVNLPGEDGIALCRSLKLEQSLRPPAIFLTARGDLANKLRGFEAGAVDYMVKPFAPAELLARIRAVVVHGDTAGGGSLQVGEYRLDVHRALLSRGGRSLPLQATPLAILRRLMQAHPGTVTRQALYDELWGDDTPNSDSLRTHVYQLRQLLLERFGEAPIATVRGLGYRFGSAP